MSEDSRERIISAAGPIFARKGLKGTKVREICSAADVNIASVNYYFGGKEALYLETVKLAHEQKTNRVPLPPMNPRATREQKLYGFVRTILERLLGEGPEGWQTQLLIREMIEPTHACQRLVEDYIRPQFQRLLEIIDEFVSDAATPEERYQLGFSVVGQCLHYRVAGGFVAMLLESQQLEDFQDVDLLARRITRFSIAALQNWSAAADCLKRSESIGSAPALN